MSAKPEYVNLSGRPQPLASGQCLAPEASTTRVDPKDPNDKHLIDKGIIAPKEEEK